MDKHQMPKDEQQKRRLEERNAAILAAKQAREQAAENRRQARKDAEKMAAKGGMEAELSRQGRSAKQLEKRRQAWSDVIVSERVYVDCLYKVVLHYMLPLRKERDLDVAQDVVEKIFGNLEALSTFHSKFLKDLESTVNYAAPFNNFCSHMSLYSQYIDEYSSMLEAIDGQRQNESFQNFLADTSEEINADLMSLLILPVKRVPRYEILLRELRSCTPAGHAEVRDLDQALQKIIIISERIKTLKDDLEAQTKLVEVQNRIRTPMSLLNQGRTLRYEGLLSQKTNNPLTPVHTRYFYLFSDVLIWTNPEATKYLGKLALRGATLRDHYTGFELVGESTVTVITQDAEEKSEWVSHVTDALNLQTKKERWLSSGKTNESKGANADDAWATPRLDPSELAQIQNDREALSASKLQGAHV